MAVIYLTSTGSMVRRKGQGLQVWKGEEKLGDLKLFDLERLVAVGYLHGLRYGRSSLALDVVEPFRQPVVDRLTLRLFNRKQLSEKDFEGGEKGVRLGEESRKRYLAHYDEQMRSASGGPGSETWRKVLRSQVQDLQKMVMQGEVRPFFTWKG